MTIPLYERATEAARFIRSQTTGHTPRVALVLGSGLGGVAVAIQDRVELRYEDIPHFCRSTVEGHEGRLIIGSCGGVEVVAMKGRFHFYEGYSMEDVTLPIRVFSLLEIGTLVLTNASGGTSPALGPGSLMLITDHINMMGDNPLRGQNDERFGTRFPDMTSVYAPDLADVAREISRESGIPLEEGIYLGLRGPSYETPAEVRMYKAMGGDALGMSTVPEAIVARHSGMKVIGFSCVTNTAAGLTSSPIDHAEVMRVGATAGRQLAELIIRLLPRIVV